MARRELHRRHLAAPRSPARPTRCCNPATGEVLDEVAVERRAPTSTTRSRPRPAAFEAWSPHDAPRSGSRCCTQGRRRDRGRPGRRSSELEIRNVGKPRSIIDFEMDLTVDNWRFFAAGARFLEGRGRRRVPGGPHVVPAPRPARRRRVDRAVELPAQHGDVEARPRARGGQHGRAQAVGAHAAHRAAARRDHRRHPPARRAQRRHRPRRDTRARRSSRIPTSRWCRSPATSRPARRSPGPRPTRSSACTSSSAARRR